MKRLKYPGERSHRLWPRRILSAEEYNHLQERGYAYCQVPDVSAHPKIIQSFEEFVKRRMRESKAVRTRWSFGIDDPTDFDDGFVEKEGEQGSDQKYYFHFSGLLPQFLYDRGVVLSPEDQDFLELCKIEWDRMRWLSQRIANILDSLIPRRISYSFRTAWDNAQEKPAKFSRDKLRIAQYRPTNMFRRARPHRDRSLFSFHLMQTGGVFYHCKNACGEDKVPIDHRSGFAILFFGLKAERLTDSACVAPWHGADATPGESRSVITYFAHANNELQNSWEVK